MNPIDLIGVWVGVFITLMVLSFLYKENPFFRLTEYAFIGLAAGYALSRFPTPIRKPSPEPNLRRRKPNVHRTSYPRLAILRPVHEEILVTIPAALESIHNRSWFRGHYLERICNVFCETTDRNHDSSLYQMLYNSLDNIVLSHADVSLASPTLFYTEETEGVWGGFTKIGKYFILATLGAVFGSTVLGRMAIIIQRVQFLLGNASFPWHALRMGTATEGAYAPIGVVAFLVIFGYYLLQEKQATRCRNETESD